MKVSLNWLKELVDYQLSTGDLANQLSLTSIGVKEQSKDFIELDLTYNRGDLLSLRGVAYEVAAITDSPLKFLTPTPQDFTWVGQKLPKLEVGIEDESVCPIYCIVQMDGLKTTKSNEDRIKKLNDSGVRDINSIADITNLIMLEYGQPMHAFDRDKVSGHIEVRKAKRGEQIVTIDGKNRDLDPQDLLIADSSGPIGIAGIMGGKETEISDSTKSILLEAAIFDPTINRRSSKRHGLYSEASKRFQHGLSKMRLLQALDGAIKMYQDMGAKLTAITFIGDFNHAKKTIEIKPEKLNSLIGTKLDLRIIVECLKKLNFTVSESEDYLEVIPPYFRLDINIAEDVYEEVARIYGYEKINGVKLTEDSPIKLDQTLPNFIYKLKKALADVGFTENQSYSFYSSNTVQNLDWSGNLDKLVSISNPISSETQYLRVNLWPNLLETVNKNIRKGYKDIALLEVGKTYLLQEKDLPKEPYKLAAILVNQTDNPLVQLKELVDKAFKNLALDIEFKECKGAEAGQNFFHPNRFLDVLYQGKNIGCIAEIHPRVVNKYGIDKRVAVLEIDIEIL